MKIHAKNLEQEALEQFKQCLLDESCIDWALMPDAHTWYTLPIWWVILNNNKIFPSYVWYDIGCWVCSVKTNMTKAEITWVESAIFNSIYNNIPCWEWKGWNYNKKLNSKLTEFWQKIFESNWNQIWTLGWWNHFIEIWYDEQNTIWVTIHSWSRWFGYKIADYYMRLAKTNNIDTVEFERKFELANDLVKKHNPEKYWEILQSALDKYIVSQTKWECGWNNWFKLDSKEWKDYLMDMTWALEFALENRKLMMKKVLTILWAKELLFINKNHNCADILPNNEVLHRKWATSSYKWELWVIPWNMKDWVVIVEWLWNPDFLNCSSHWAWRILSRKKAKEQIQLEHFIEDMKWITAKVQEETKDESRFAYKNFNEVLELQKDSIKILHKIKPMINIKW